MHCERCGDYRLYSQPIVAVRPINRHLAAVVEREGTPAGVDGPEPVGRWHVGCYEAARREDGRLPALDIPAIT